MHPVTLRQDGQIGPVIGDQADAELGAQRAQSPQELECLARTRMFGAELQQSRARLRADNAPGEGNHHFGWRAELLETIDVNDGV